MLCPSLDFFILFFFMFIEAYHTVSVAFAKHPTSVKETRINIKVNYCLALSLHEKLLYLRFYWHVFLTVCPVFKCILGEGRKEKGSVHMAWSELVTEWHISSSTLFFAHLTLADQYEVRTPSINLPQCLIHLLWKRQWDTWTPPLKAATLIWPCTPSFYKKYLMWILGGL